MTVTTTTLVEDWVRLVSAHFVGLAVRDAPHPFRGTVEQVDLGRGIRLSRVSASASRVVRTPRLVSADASDDVLFLVHLAGEGSVWDEGGQRVMPPGYGSVHVADRPYQLLFGTAAREIVLQLPRRLLPSPSLVAPERRREGVAPGDPRLRVFRAFVGELLNVAPSLPTDAREELGQTAVELLASVLRERDGFPRAGEPTLLRTMQAFVRGRLDDPDLGPPLIAAAHRVSLRRVHQVFAAAGTSPGAFIREERLERARRLLADARHGRLPLSAVAARAGLGSDGTLNRAFRRRYGTTPGEWRRSMTGDMAPV